MTGPARQFLSAAELAREYRPSMPTDALHLWAQDAAALLRAQAEAGQTQIWVAPALPPEPLPEAIEYHRALMTVACQDTTDYDNAVTETVCDRLLEAIAGQGEPSFGGPRLNMIVRLIRDLRAQAEAGAERPSAPPRTITISAALDDRIRKLLPPRADGADRLDRSSLLWAALDAYEAALAQADAGGEAE